MKKWIVVYTKPKHEKAVTLELEGRGFESYLPLIKKKRQWSDRKKWVEFPLFQSYVFVKININETYYILKISGITKIIRLGNDIATIRDNEIDTIKMMIDGEYFPKLENYFLEGDKVIVKSGPLKGINGEVIRINKENRLVFRVNAIQNSISIKINQGLLEYVN